jgi:hypothetical protein
MPICRRILPTNAGPIADAVADWVRVFAEVLYTWPTAFGEFAEVE